MSTSNNGPCTSSAFDFVPPCLYIVLSMIFSIITAYGTYKYVRYHQNCELCMKPPKSLFIIGLIFFVLSSVYLFSFGMVQLSLIIECLHTSPVEWEQKWPSKSIFEWLLTFICYSAHVYLLWLNLFTRITFVFDGTVYALSRLTSNVFKALLIALPFIIPLCLLLAIALPHGIIVLWLFYVFSISFSVSLSVLFAYKLKQTYESSRSAAYNFGALSVIVKNTTLCVMSSLFTIFVLLSTMIYQKLFKILTLFDIFSNVLCIYFTYKFSEQQYYNYCGCVDHNVRMFLRSRGFRVTPVMSSSRSKQNVPHLSLHQQASAPSNSAEIVEVADNAQSKSEPHQDMTSNDQNKSESADM